MKYILELIVQCSVLSKTPKERDMVCVPFQKPTIFPEIQNLLFMKKCVYYKDRTNTEIEFYDFEVESKNLKYQILRKTGNAKLHIML